MLTFIMPRFGKVLTIRERVIVIQYHKYPAMIKILINDKVYIRNIGYAVLLQCPNKQSIELKDSSVQIYEDPYDALETLFQPLQQPTQKPPPEDLKLSLIPSNYLVYTKSSNIKNTLTLRVKVFFEKRQLSNIVIPINTTIGDLKKSVFKALDKNPDMFYATRLFYPSVQLVQLQDSKQVWEYGFRDYSSLVMITHQTFLFTSPKQSTVKIKNQTLTKNGDQAYSTNVANIALSKHGKYYWEIRIDKCQSEEDIFVGVAYKNIDATCCPTHCKYWGIMPLFAKRFSPQDVGNLVNYGSIYKLGETIGVMVTFINKLATISFYRNGISLGVAYQGVYGILHPAITLFGASNTVVEISYDPKAPMPFIN